MITQQFLGIVKILRFLKYVLHHENHMDSMFVVHLSAIIVKVQCTHRVDIYLFKMFHTQNNFKI